MQLEISHMGFVLLSLQRSGALLLYIEMGEKEGRIKGSEMKKYH